MLSFENLTDFLIFGPFKTIVRPPRLIIQCYKLTRISITTRTLCFQNKKIEIIYTSTDFKAKITVFSTKKALFSDCLKVVKDNNF